MNSKQILVNGISNLLKCAENFVYAAGVVEGDQVLILRDTGVDSIITDLTADAVRAVGGHPTITVTDPFKLWSLPNSGVFEAAKASDAFLSATTNLIGRNIDALQLRKAGVKIAQLVTPNLEILTSEGALFPLEIMNAMIKKTHKMVAEGKRLTVTDPKGTSLTADYNQEAVAGRTRTDVRISKGGLVAFPFGVIGVEPVLNATGEVHWDMINDMPGTLENWSAPVKYTVEKGRVKSIEGGTEAEHIRNTIKGIEGADRFIEIQWGLNPKMPIAKFSQDRNKVPIERHSGIMHMAIANGYETQAIHIDAELLRPTLYIDDTPVIKDGRLLLLDDDEIQRLAAKYGKPSEILSETS